MTKENFSPIETQDQFDEAIKARLERQAKKFEGYLSPEEVEKKMETAVSFEQYKTETDEYKKTIETLNKKVEELTAKPDELQTKIDELTKKAQEYERASEKNKIANQIGLPFESVKFIAGDTVEEIKESAEQLKKIIGASQKAKMPLATPEPTKPADEKEQSLKELRKQLMEE